MNKSLTTTGQKGIIEQVKSIGIEDADDLAVMNYLMQVRIVSELIKMNKGIVDMNRWIIDASPRTQDRFYAVAETYLKKMEFDPPLLYVYVYNTGLGNLYLRFNELHGDITTEIPIASGFGEGFSVGYPSIKRIYYQATAPSSLEIYTEN